MAARVTPVCVKSRNVEVVSAVERAEKAADDGEQQSERETTKEQRAHRGGSEIRPGSVGGGPGRPRISYVAASAAATTRKSGRGGTPWASRRIPRETLC